MRIAVVGAGNIGRNLARLFAAAGHQVTVAGALELAAELRGTPPSGQGRP